MHSNAIIRMVAARVRRTVRACLSALVVLAAPVLWGIWMGLDAAQE